MNKKIIYDFGSNNGDDIPYYLLKSDLVIAVGTRLGLQQTGFNYESFISKGKIIHIDLDKKRVQAEEILKIIKDYKEKSNKDLHTAMEFINEDFKVTKESIIKLTHHLDSLENTYNLIHKEYTERIKSK